MKESDFIEQNQKKWQEVEQNLNSNQLSPSDTSKLFIQVTDDLSYARTFYKNRSVKIYLNEIAKFLFNDINKSRESNWKAFIRFWKKDLPIAVFMARRSMLISFIVFTACFILGVVTSIYDPDFCKSILSAKYVAMTEENIDKGDPMAVYKQHSEMQTFLPIFWNNIRVDFLTFFSGIFFAVGSLFVLVVNGVMVGVFQYFFIERDLFWDSFLTIWTHGTLEISAAIISGGAGLMLGKGLLFPGTYTRFHALKKSGMIGLKIICGVVPMTLVAAFIEGFLTRHTDIPDLVRFGFIFASLAFVLVYFLWYPRRVAKATPNYDISEETDPVFKHQNKFSPHEIQDKPKLAKTTFRLIFKHFNLFGTMIGLLSLILGILVATDSFNLFIDESAMWFEPSDLFNYFQYPLLGIACIACFVIIQYKSMVFLKQTLDPDSSDFSKQSLFYLSLLFSFIFAGFMGMINEEYRMLAFVLYPFLSLVLSISVCQNTSIFKSVNLTGSLLNKQWGTFFIGMLFTFSVTWIFFFMISGATKYLLIENSLLWILTDDELTAGKIKFGIAVFRVASGFFLYMIMNAIFNSMFFYTLKEINTAQNLIERIHNIKASK